MTVSPVSSLRALADQATPEPWVAGIYREDHAVMSGERGDWYVASTGFSEDDAEFIAAASPDVVAALCDLYDEVARLCDDPDDTQEWESAPAVLRTVHVVDVRRIRAALSAARRAIEGSESDG